MIFRYAAFLIDIWLAAARLAARIGSFLPRRRRKRSEG